MNPKKVVASSEEELNSVGKELEAVGNSAEIANTLDGISGTVKVTRDQKTNHYSFSIRFDMSDLNTCNKHRYNQARNKQWITCFGKVFC